MKESHRGIAISDNHGYSHRLGQTMQIMQQEYDYWIWGRSLKTYPLDATAWYIWDRTIYICLCAGKRLSGLAKTMSNYRNDARALIVPYLEMP